MSTSVKSTGQTPQTAEASSSPAEAKSGVQFLPKENTSILACLSKIKDFFEKIFKHRNVSSNTTVTARKVSDDPVPENKNQSFLETLFGAPLEDNASVIELDKGIKEIWKPEKMTPEANEAMEKLREALVDLLKEESNVSKKQAYLRAMDYAKMVGLDTGLLKSFSPWNKSKEVKPEVKTLKAFTTIEEILKEIEEKQKTLEKDLGLARTQKGITYPIKKLSNSRLLFEHVRFAVDIAKTGKYQIGVDHLKSFQTEYQKQFDMLDAQDKKFWNDVISFLKSKVTIQTDSSTPTKPSGA